MQLKKFFGERISKSVIALQLMLISLTVFAQGEKVEISIGKKSNWYEQPWVWVVGAAVFILLLIAILRSGKKS